MGCKNETKEAIMTIKTELLKRHIRDYVSSMIDDFEIDENKIANSTAILVLGEIQKIIGDDNLSDFDCVEKIVCLFEEYKLNAGGRHDF